MKGIILAGGMGTRLYPITLPVCKQLLPVYDKPMIYYPLSVLMMTGLKEILIISTPKDTDRFKELLGDGSRFGLKLEYVVQENAAGGLAEALFYGEEFLAGDSVCFILGDNILFGHGLNQYLTEARQKVETNGGAQIFGYYVNDPERYGIIEFTKQGKVVSLEEKPEQPKTNYAIVGLYFLDNSSIEIAKKIDRSDRGQLEITDVLKVFLKERRLGATPFGRGLAWLDAGTHESLLETSEFVSTMEKRTGLKIGCIEEVAFKMGLISKQKLLALAEPLENSGYGRYLTNVANEKIDPLYIP